MHTLDVGTPNSIIAASSVPCFTFTSTQQVLSKADPNIADLVASKTARKEFFYGIEIMAHHEGKATCVDFNLFMPLLPSLISIVWSKQFSESMRTTTINQLANMQLIPHLNSRMCAMPHLSLYRLTQKNLDAFSALNLTNVLVIRGDQLDDNQDYRYAYQVVEYLRRARGSNMSIAVGGYPEGYLSLSTEPQDKAQNMKYLKQKIDAGADFIITQLCYSGDMIIEFIRDARAAGITAPIVVGMVVPDSMAKYLTLERVTGVTLAPAARNEVKKLKLDNDKITDYFIQLTVRNIQQIMDADLGVYGIQFFTLNRFEPIVDVLRELRTRGILKEPSANA